MNTDGGNVQQLTDNPHFPILDAKWSPDGSKIAVVSLIGDSLTYPSFRRVIFVMNADGSHRYQLTPQWFDMVDSTQGKVEYGGAFGMNPVWSPDSRQIAYNRLMVPEAWGNWDIFLININGTDERRITGTINLTEGVTGWSNDGSALWGGIDGYPATDSTGQAIPYEKMALFNLQGKILKSWGNPGESWEVPIPSHDGNNIVFVFVNKDQLHDVYMINSDGSGLSRLTNGLCQYPQPVAWSSDDSRILLSCSQFNNENRLAYRILLINSDGTNPTDITPFAGVYLKAISWRR